MSKLNPNALIVARGVAQDVATGSEWGDAIARAAEALDLSRGCVIHCVRLTAEYLQDPYLESLAYDDTTARRAVLTAHGVQVAA